MNKRKDSKNRVLKSGEYERPNGTYEYRYTKDGKRYSTYAQNLEELRELELKIGSDILKGRKSPTKSLTVNDVYSRWIRIKRGLKDNTFQNYKYMYEHFVMPSFGCNRISMIKKSDVRAFYNSLAEGDIRMKASTIDSIQTVLFQVFQLAVDDEMIYSNPCMNALKELKRASEFKSKPREALTIEQQELLMQYVSGNNCHNRWKPIVTTFLFTGMRVGELTGLRWCDIDFEKNIIHVDHTLVYYNHSQNGCFFGINTTKTKAGTRDIPMTDIVKDAFLEEKRYHELANIDCSISVDGYTDFVFINKCGNVFNQSDINRAFKRIIKECNLKQIDKKSDVLLPNFSCHNLRHTFATRLSEANVNIKVAQVILGHSDAETTLNIYTHATPDFKAEEMYKFVNSLTTLTTNLTTNS